MADNKENTRLERAAYEAVKIGGRDELRARMNQFEADWQTEQAGGRTLPFWKRPKFWTVAVAASLLIVVGLWQFVDQAPSSQALFAEYFVPYRPPVVVRGTEQNNEFWQNAVKAYVAEDFDSAANLFEESLTENNGPAYLSHFYRGVSLLAMQPPSADEAIEAFELAGVGDHDYVEQAQWQLALAYLANEQKSMAEDILRAIVVNRTYHFEEAAQILKTL